MALVNLNQDSLKYRLTAVPRLKMNPVTSVPDYKSQLMDHRKMLRDWITSTSDSFPLDNIQF